MVNIWSAVEFIYECNGSSEHDAMSCDVVDVMCLIKHDWRNVM